MYKKYAMILLVFQVFVVMTLGFTTNELVECNTSISGYQPVIQMVALEKTEELFSISEEDKLILYKIVEAEAGCEDRIGKILVANVVLNRLENPDFPDTVKGVVFQKEGGTYQFSPIGNGRYDCASPKEETVEAVDSALAGEDYSEGALYFVARTYADGGNLTWFDTNLQKVTEHGGHTFYK